MILPIEITIRDTEPSKLLEDHIRQKAEKLNTFYPRIMRCHVTVEVPQKHQNQGKLFTSHIEITVPGKTLVSNRQKHEDPYVVIRDAFDAIARQLEDYARRSRGEEKTHEPLTQGRVNRLFVEEGYGFIDGADGNEYYFSFTNVQHPEFSHLKVGDTVEFLTISADEGLQAQRVTRKKTE